MEPITVVLPRPRTAVAAPSGVAFRRTVSMTAGADEPLRVLADAPTRASVSCHPCDEAIVRHLLAHVRRHDCPVLVDVEVDPGVLAVSVRLTVAS